MELGDSTISPLGLTVPLWLDGNETTTTLTYDVISPSTNQVLYRASSASVDDANRAIESARVAFESWSRFKPALRRDIFLRAAEVLQTRKEEKRNIIKRRLERLIQCSTLNSTWL